MWQPLSNAARLRAALDSLLVHSVKMDGNDRFQIILRMPAQMAAMGEDRNDGKGEKENPSESDSQPEAQARWKCADYRLLDFAGVGVPKPEYFGLTCAAGWERSDHD